MLYLEVCCRVVIGLVFLLAVVGKLRGRAELTAFTESLGSFGLRSARLRSALATSVITVEAVTVVLLAVAPRLGLLAATVSAAVLGAVALAHWDDLLFVFRGQHGTQPAHNHHH